MNIFHTMDAIEKFLNVELKTFTFQTKSGVPASPQTFQGYLPPKKNTKERNNNDDDDYYPFIIIRYVNKSSDSYEGRAAHFRLVIGTYSDDEENGWRDPVTIMEVIERRLIEKQDIGSATLIGEIDSVLFEEQKRPFYHGYMEFTLALPKISTTNSTEGRSILDEYDFTQIKTD